MSLLVCWAVSTGIQAQSLTVMSYNCENAFDTIHDAGKNDQAYLPDSPRRWTRNRMYRKLKNTGKVIAAVSETRPVDIVCLEEVENDTVLSYLLRRTPLASVGYEYVMTRSADQRGIDVAMVYSPFTFHLLNHHAIRAGTSTPTRDVLYVSGTAGADTFDIYVVHLPSKLNGKTSEKNRRIVAETIMQSVDSLRAVRQQPRVIVLGDFNDGPQSKLSKTGFGSLVCLTESYQLLNKNPRYKVGGTYKYQGCWDCIDQIFTSPNLSGSRAYIANLPFLLEEDNKYGGLQPSRTYIGYKYNHGYSDHLPVLLLIEQNVNAVSTP